MGPITVNNMAILINNRNVYRELYLLESQAEQLLIDYSQGLGNNISKEEVAQLIESTDELINLVEPYQMVSNDYRFNALKDKAQRLYRYKKCAEGFC